MFLRYNIFLSKSILIIGNISIYTIAKIQRKDSLYLNEKTTDSKVMKAITKMVEDWVKTKVCIVTESQY
jgi:hypothetical protein